MQVYRLTKANDATTNKSANSNEKFSINALPDNHKFSQSDVVILTLQPQGSGDFLGPYSMPLNDEAVTLEARVLNVGPAYVDIAVPAGKFEDVFGPAPNNYGPMGKGDPKMRIRVDRFFSDVSYRRMVYALTQATSISTQISKTQPSNEFKDGFVNLCVDDDIRRVITATYDLLSKGSGNINEEPNRLLCDLVR